MVDLNKHYKESSAPGSGSLQLAVSTKLANCDMVQVMSEHS